ncbi:MAG TPA: hypothetical protein VK003_11740 [Oceanobacillus sp.]|nr:hypothetical protein [Oceanobacillus sp.]
MARTAVHRLTPQERNAAKEEMRAILIEHARARQTITYSALAMMIESVRIHHRSPLFMQLLTEVCREEERLGHGMLCALVVSKTTGIPGGGYFSGMAALGHDVSELEASWRAELEQVFDYWSNH